MNFNVFRRPITLLGSNLTRINRSSVGGRCVSVASIVVPKSRCISTSVPHPNMNLSSVVHYLEDGATTDLAESWDNVGLLVEPSPPHTVHNVLLTNDLTLDVCEEAIAKESNLIISYHPPIFSALKRLTQKSVKERIIVKCLENKIAIYSPHTVYDNMKDGVNQWIIGAFEKNGLSNVNPVEMKYSSSTPSGATHRMALRLDSHADILITSIENILTTKENGDLSKSLFITKAKNEDGAEILSVVLHVTPQQLCSITEFLEDYPGILETCSVSRLENLPMPGYGAGLSTVLENDLTTADAVKCVKTHMKLGMVRLALGRGKTMESRVKKIAVCAGSGRSVLAGHPADLYVTGEMSHHDLLASTESGVSVILTEHSNCERGFLVVMKERLEKKFDQTEVKFLLSEKDHDPVCIV